MDAVKFLKEKERMCNYYNRKCKNGCPIDGDFPCDFMILMNPNDIVNKVEQWSKEHPRKTRLQDFLEKYPNALMDDVGEPDACSASLGYCKNCDGYNNCKDCWNTPME